jgi:HEAT repeat protein
MWNSLLLSALVLGGPADPPADNLVHDLVAVFQDRKNSPEVRTTALRALAPLGWPARANVPDLIKFLDDPEERKSASDTIGPYIVAIESLGRLGPAARSAVPTLVKAKGIAAPYDQTIEGALENILLPSPGTVYGLLYSLRDNDPAVRLLAVKALRTFPADYALTAPLLREAKEKDPDADVKSAAAETLKVLTKAEVERLVQLLKDKDENVRVLAAKALGHLGSDAKSALPALKTTADTDKDADVRAVAKNAIGKITAKP